MKGTESVIGTALVTMLSFHATATTRYVDVNSANPVSPYTNWATAATVIQDAVDAAQSSDLVLVADGVYKTGGRVYSEGLTNRVVVNKAIRLQSVNGPDVTIIA